MTDETAQRPYWESAPATRDDFDEIDRAALDLAIQLTIDQDPEMACIVGAYLRDNEWWEAAAFASYCRQMDHLQLNPSDPPPCWIDEDEIDDIIAQGPGDFNRGYGSALLLKKMVAVGISRFEPRPIDRLTAVKRGK